MIYRDHNGDTLYLIDGPTARDPLQLTVVSLDGTSAEVLVPAQQLLHMIDQLAPEALAAYVREAPPADREETPEQARRREGIEAAEQLGRTVADIRDAFAKGLAR